ncbi:hypothetical protein ACQP1G_37555 [Nocardia sp. CA-107356]|uniref:hypothetical protein n=1 Tax=Nocardia sp. CA-107356 TaxID=3239972 RepID=UPI003D9124CA
MFYRAASADYDGDEARGDPHRCLGGQEDHGLKDVAVTRGGECVVERMIRRVVKVDASQELPGADRAIDGIGSRPLGVV